MSGLEFNDTPRRIRWGTPFNGIFLDNDGSLTGLGPNTWATPYKSHHDQPECTKSSDVHNGIICDSTVQIRRVAVWASQPRNLFLSMGFKIMKNDDTIFEGMTPEQKTEHIEDKKNYATIPFKLFEDPD